METVQSVSAFLEQLAPARLAEEWDNVGLLVGRRQQNVAKLMTCLTVTPATAAEAIEAGAQLIVAHHPLPFRPVTRLTDNTIVGRLLLDLIEARVAIYRAHTAFDSAELGVNQRLAAGLGLRGVAVGPPSARRGHRPLGLADRAGVARTLGGATRKFLSIERLQAVGEPGQLVRTVAVACSTTDEFLDAARQNGCDAMVIGEARFHTCLEAEAAGMALLLPGHYASERFAMDCLAAVLAEQFTDLSVWASRRERDPLRWG